MEKKTDVVALEGGERKMVCQCMWWRERMARELEVVTMALPFSAWSLANPISTSDSAAVDDIDFESRVLQGVW